jgi:hypothetical protein
MIQLKVYMNLQIYSDARNADSLPDDDELHRQFRRRNR